MTERTFKVGDRVLVPRDAITPAVVVDDIDATCAGMVAVRYADGVVSWWHPNYIQRDVTVESIARMRALHGDA